jgi:hypothetical protein
MHRGLFWREGDNVSNGEWKKKMKTEALNDEKIKSWENSEKWRSNNSNELRKMYQYEI